MLSYHENTKPLSLNCKTPCENIFLIFFWSTLKHGLQLLNKKPRDIHGQFEVVNTIPMGAEIGFFAALSVVIARWLVWKHYLDEGNLIAFATELENSLHEEKTGAEIAGAMSEHIIHFEGMDKFHECQIKWQPKLYLSFSGLPRKHETVDKIAHRKSHLAAQQIDNIMENSALMIENALQENEQEGFKDFASGLNQAKKCYEKWGLVSPELKKHMQQLKKLGAVAAKPIDSGYVISLWKESPPPSELKLKPIFIW